MAFVFMGSKGNGAEGLSGMSKHGVNEAFAIGPFTFLRMESADGIGEANGQYVSYGMGISLTVLQLGYIKTSSYTVQGGLEYNASTNNVEAVFDNGVNTKSWAGFK